MAQQLVDRRDIDFVIWEQMNGEQYLQYDLYSDYDRKTCDMIISEARTLVINELLPILAEGDREGVRFDNGAVYVPESFHRVYGLILEGGWNNLGTPEKMGGQGAPPMVAYAADGYFMAANWALMGYAEQGTGSADMIQKYGTEEQRNTYVGKLISGEWGGTMLLTEPEAGSDVGALTTTAVRKADGTYSLTGNKIFITNGEHDLVQNIIHPVLARIEGDPPGTRGLSLFIVPKFLVKPDGSLGERNDIRCEGVEQKHGIHASATCSMTLGAKGECTGFLLGEERMGMRAMFNMVNLARMATGTQALAYASASYLLALDYAKKRIQGRDLDHLKDASAPSVPIIRHPDVRRNLLWMKSYVDGMHSLLHYALSCKIKADLGETEERRLYSDLFEILTPIVKDYNAVQGYDVCIQAIQVFGGAGYTKDYLVEQYARDCKVTSIFEGTSGIQAMDLLVRKLGRQDGKVFMHLLGEMRKTVAQAGEIEDLKDLAGDLESTVNRLGETAMHLGQIVMSPEFKAAFAHATPFLYAMGDTIMGWMLLWRAVVAASKLELAKERDLAFYKGQIKTAEFFVKTELPVTKGKMDAIKGTCRAALDMEEDGFEGL